MRSKKGEKASGAPPPTQRRNVEPSRQKAVRPQCAKKSTALKEEGGNIFLPFRCRIMTTKTPVGEVQAKLLLRLRKTARQSYANCKRETLVQGSDL